MDSDDLVSYYREKISSNPDKYKYEKYLYYPAFATSEDIQRFKVMLNEANFDGIYAENYSGLIFAREENIKVFAGTGFNLFNQVAIFELLRFPEVEYYTISKEANIGQIKNLITEKSFILSLGDIKIMDLIYCPFGKTCTSCDKKAVYTLTDENNREFPVRRYISANGSCRFEVYNCANLIGTGLENCNKLLDFSICENKLKAIACENDEEEQKKIYSTYTSGHFRRGVL